LGSALGGGKAIIFLTKSLDELIVIETKVFGTFGENNKSHTPYFTPFNTYENPY
jgi:hypothetical protein